MTPLSSILLELMDDLDPSVSLPESLCRLAVARLPIAAACIALTDDDGNSRVLLGSDERAVAWGSCELTVGEGPGYDAVRTGRLVQQQHLARTGPLRWPGYAEAVVSSGVAAVFAFPLRIGAIRLGALVLHADAPTVLDDEALTCALHLVDVAVQVVLHVGAGTRDAPAHHGLDGAESSPFLLDACVHQATGMVSVQARVSLADALLLLRGRAYGEQRSITDVAREVVGRRTAFA